MKSFHILNLIVKDEPGTLIRIAGLIWRRGFNIDTITVGKTEIPNVSRIVISLNSDEHILEQLKKQLSKVVAVLKVSELKENESIVGELCYIKVEFDGKKDEILKQIEANNRKVVHSDEKSAIICITGNAQEIDKFINVLNNYKINIARTGLTGIGK